LLSHSDAQKSLFLWAKKFTKKVTLKKKKKKRKLILLQIPFKTKLPKFGFAF